MEIQEIGPWVNTVLLIVIFFYQKNKNKVLEDRIDQQNRVIGETKSLIENQASAIAGQKSVVETALRYSESFSPEKLEKIIRKELELEHKDEKENLEKHLTSLIQEKDEFENKLNGVVDVAADKAAHLAGEYIAPLLKALTIHLVPLPSEARLKIINDIDEGPAKEMLIGTIEKVDAAIKQIVTNNQNQADA